MRSILLTSIIAGTSVMSAWSQVRVPDELTHTQFAGSDLAPSPACLCAAVTGEVFVGVDKNGSLGKGPGKGYILRLKDTNQDGKADEHTVFANVDNPRESDCQLRWSWRVVQRMRLRTPSSQRARMPR